MALDSYMYSNPEFVLQRKQELEARKIKGCTGCKHHKTMDFRGDLLHRCDIKPRGFGTANCQQYTRKG